MLYFERKSVFETNSSSSHALSLAKGDILDGFPSKDILRSGVIRIHPPITEDGPVSTFGCDFYRYYKFENKLTYALVHAAGGKLQSEDYNVDVIPALVESKPAVARLINFIKETTGCRVEFYFRSGAGDDLELDVDHQSVGSFSNELDSPNFLKSFLFMARSYVQTGSDGSAGPYTIPTDIGPEVNRPDLIEKLEGLNNTLVLEKIGHKLLISMNDAETTVDIKRFRYPHLFGLEESGRASIIDYSIVVPLYVSSFPLEVADLAADEGYDPDVLAMDLLLEFVVWQSRRDGHEAGRLLTIAPNLKPVIHIEGSDEKMFRNIFDVPGFKMVWRCDSDCLKAVKTSIKDAEKRR